MQRRSNEGEFTEQILSDLISQGYKGNELMEELNKMQRQIRPAVESMLTEAGKIASLESGYTTYEDIFGEVDSKLSA